MICLETVTRGVTPPSLRPGRQRRESLGLKTFQDFQGADKSYSFVSQCFTSFLLRSYNCVEVPKVMYVAVKGRKLSSSVMFSEPSAGSSAPRVPSTCCTAPCFETSREQVS